MEDKYTKLAIELEQQFPNCPFDISCIDEIEELDEIFTDEPVIFIFDDRSEYRYGMNEDKQFTYSKYI